MKATISFIIFFNLVIINCASLRNLKLARDQEKYDKLCEAAKKTIYQLYKIKDIDFEDTTFINIVDNKKTLYIAVDENPTIPTETVRVDFTIANGTPKLPAIEYPKELKFKFEIFGKAYDLEEEFKAIANAIASGYNDGKVIAYKKAGQKVSQNRFKCFVNSADGKEYGSFEIVQEDVNDSKSLSTTIANWYQKIESILKVVNDDVKVVSELVATVKGIVKDENKPSSSSSFLKMSCFLFIFALL